MPQAHNKDIRFVITVLATIAFFAFQMYIALVRQLTPMLQSPVHLAFALFMVYLYNPIDKSYQKKVRKAAEAAGTTPDPVKMNKWAFLRWLDLLFFAAIIFCSWYSVSSYQRLRDFTEFVDDVLSIDNTAMVVYLLLLLEAVRRTLGNILLGFIVMFIVYAWTAPYLPGILFTAGMPFQEMLDQFTTGMTMGEKGIFGTPLYTSASSLFYFIVFGVFFSQCGGGQLLMDIGMKFSNKSAGGPAKAAVLSSGMMGMVSGSAVANVSTTGVMTIPMMKRIGYEPEEAGAIEAVASTGGQIMPPIMGVGAFIMAEMIGVNYFKVASSAILPAVAYYYGVFVLVTYLAHKRASRSTQKENVEIQIADPITPRIYLLIPVILLIVSIISGNSLMRSGMIGIFSCLGCNIISYFVGGRKNYCSLKGLWKCCLDGAKQSAEIAIPTAACGIIINVVTGQTSLATNLSSVIGGLGTDNLFFALLIGMIGCMILGMALPTVAAYLVGVILFVPCIKAVLPNTMSSGTQDMVANMFVFYYGIMAQITPPVCVASYTAAGIADGDAMKTGLKGMLFALVGFLVPFVFVYNPPVLLLGSVPEIIISAVQLLAGTYLLAVTVAGFYRTNLLAWERVLTFAGAILLITPDNITSLVGIALGGAALLCNIGRAKKAKAAAV